MTSVPDQPDGNNSDWPFAVRDVDDVLAKIERKAKQRKTRRRRVAGGAAGVALIALAAIWAVPFLRHTSSLATIAAHRQSVPLADGSLAELNAQTSVHTDFRYGRRIVRLDRGEAFFSVAKDAAHPFLVETPVGTVRVTGTRFNVRLIGERAEVTLLEGKVTVERQDTELGKLTPGEQFIVSDTGQTIQRLGEAELENSTAWREGRLALDGSTLGDAVERLAAYHGKRIAVDPQVSSLRTGGSVSLEDLGAALAALQATLPIHVLPTEGGNFRIIAR